MVRVDSILGAPTQGGDTRPAVIAALDHIAALDRQTIAARLTAIEPLAEPPSVQLAQDAARGNLLGVVQVGPHRVELVGLSQPAPQAVTARVVEASHWDTELKRAARAHRAHVIVQHAGGRDSDILERYIALFKVCHAVGGDELVAVLNDAAWTFSPAGLITEVLAPAMLSQIRRQIPPNIWTGFVGISVDDGVWFVSKGHHVFGVPDLCYFASGDLAGSAVQPNEVLEMFMNLFLYAYERNLPLLPGHSVQMESRGLMHLEEAPDVPGLQGPALTLNIVRV